jgi:hypothetical protein
MVPAARPTAEGVAFASHASTATQPSKPIESHVDRNMADASGSEALQSCSCRAGHGSLPLPVLVTNRAPVIVLAASLQLVILAAKMAQR